MRLRRSAVPAAVAAAAAVAVLLLVVVPADDRPPPTQPPAPVVTVVQDDAELLHRPPRRIAATLDDLRELGVDWVRVTAGWSVIAPAPRSARPPRGFDATDPAAYPDGAWAKLDRVARLARRRGLRLAIDIAFWAPRWAVARAGANAARHRTRVDPRHFADFAQAVARRYPRATAFTVWNEPNHPVFLLPQWERAGDRWRAAAPHDYRAMVRAAVPRIRAAAPRARVLIGATSSVGSPAGDDAGDRMSPLTFAREMACVDALMRPLQRAECRDFAPLPGDGWAHHPYSLELPPWAPDPRAENVRMGDLQRLTRLLERLHAAGRTQRRLGLYLTESGYQTDPPDPTSEVNVEDQARWLPEGERIARAHPAVRSVAQFLVRDLPRRRGSTAQERWRDYQSGLRFEDGRAKPAHHAFALGLVARRAGPGRVALWGLVRPGAGAREVRVLARDARGRWREALATRTGPTGSFQATVRAEHDETFRLHAGSRAGPLLRGAR